jgi:Zn-dependent protease with chaperone function
MDSNSPASQASLLQNVPDPDGSMTGLSLTVLFCVFAIPVVAFALWGDYFERRVRHDRLRGELDFAAESFLLNSAGLVVFILQVVNYFSLRPYQTGNESLSVLLFIGALITQSLLHLGMSRRLELEAIADREEIGLTSEGREIDADSPESDEIRPATPPSGIRPRTPQPGREWNSSLWLASLLAGYISFAGACGVLAIVAASRFGASPIATALFGVFGTGAGIIIGLSMVYALAPITVRRLFEVTPLAEFRDEDTLRLVRDCFERAKIPCPEVYVLHHAELQTHNVMIAGFTHGRGIFKPAVYITEALIADRLATVRALSPASTATREKSFTEAELRAVLLHEVSHASLHHLRRRLLLTSASVVAGLVAGTLGWIAARTFLPAGLAELIQLGIAAAVVFIPFSRVHRLVFQQELEADLHAVIELGALPEAMISALRKLDAANGRDSSVALGSHPSTEKRISELSQLVPAPPHQREKPADRDDQRKAA